MQTFRKINVALAGGLMLLGLIGATALYATERLISDVQLVDHTYDVRAALQSFDSQLREARARAVFERSRFP
jgi:CHASE3 domain sensor protein